MGTATETNRKDVSKRKSIRLESNGKKKKKLGERCVGDSEANSTRKSEEKKRLVQGDQAKKNQDHLSCQAPAEGSQNCGVDILVFPAPLSLAPSQPPLYIPLRTVIQVLSLYYPERPYTHTRSNFCLFRDAIVSPSVASLLVHNKPVKGDESTLLANNRMMAAHLRSEPQMHPLRSKRSNFPGDSGHVRPGISIGYKLRN